MIVNGSDLQGGAVSLWLTTRDASVRHLEQPRWLRRGLAPPPGVMQHLEAPALQKLLAEQAPSTPRDYPHGFAGCSLIGSYSHLSHASVQTSACSTVSG